LVARIAQRGLGGWIDKERASSNLPAAIIALPSAPTLAPDRPVRSTTPFASSIASPVRPANVSACANHMCASTYVESNVNVCVSCATASSWRPAM